MGGIMSFFAQPKPPRIIMAGLDAAGKTTILYKRKLGTVVTTVPTIGFNVETVNATNMKLEVWDVGLRSATRRLLYNYFEGMDAFVFVVDSADVERLGEAREMIEENMQEMKNKAPGCAIAVVANKQDLPNALPPAEIADRLGLGELLVEHKWSVFATAASTGTGFNELFDWLARTIRNTNNYKTLHTTIVSKLPDIKPPAKKVSTTEATNEETATATATATVTATTPPTAETSTPSSDTNTNTTTATTTTTPSPPEALAIKTG